jgi:hypothetical protein
MEAIVKDSEGILWMATGFTRVDEPVIYSGWRCLHQAEGGYPNPDHMPVVRPSLNIASVPFNQPMQWASFKINRHNPLFIGTKWRSTYNGGIAFTNNNGFDDPDAGPRADYVNGRDLLAQLPKLMKGIICGGGFYTGTPVLNLTYSIKTLFSSVAQRSFMIVKRNMQSLLTANVLTMTPGIDAIDATKPYSNTDAWADVILKKVWYFTATTRAGDKINNFPQGSGAPVYISYFLNKPAQYPLSWFEKWNASYLPDPLKIYKPL